MHGYIDKSPFIRSPLVFPPSSCRTKVIFREFTEVYAVTKSSSPLTLDTTMIRQRRGALDRAAEVPAILNSFPQGAGEKSFVERRRSNVHAFSTAHHLWFTKRFAKRERKRDGERLIIVERASRVNVTSRNNLGLERVNAKSGVQIVRRAKQRRPTRRDTVPFRCKTSSFEEVEGSPWSLKC